MIPVPDTVFCAGKSFCQPGRKGADGPEPRAGTHTPPATRPLHNNSPSLAQSTQHRFTALETLLLARVGRPLLQPWGQAGIRDPALLQSFSILGDSVIP